MKKLLFLLVCSFIISKSKAQVVFCPKGAEWHYLVSGAFGLSSNNETIKYVGDSIAGTDTLKLLSHFKGSLACGRSARKTLILQKGDTVFFNNSNTNGYWEILYNFATPVGQTWETKVYRSNISSPTLFTYTVQAINTVTINGHSLKKLSIVSSSNWSFSEVTERLGAPFLFNFSFNHPGSCDSDVFMEFLCYQDSSFGIKQMGEKSCDYYTTYNVGLINAQANTFTKIYPNPFTEFISVDFENFSDYKIVLLDLSGRCVLKGDTKLTNSSLKLETVDLQKGIYFLQIFEKDKLIRTEKIIKQ